FFQAEDGIRDFHVTGVQTCALPIYNFIFFHNQTQLFSGDPALAGKPVERDGDLMVGDSITKTWINYYKRLAKDIAPGLDGNFGRSEERRVGKECRYRRLLYR